MVASAHDFDIVDSSGEPPTPERWALYQKFHHIVVAHDTVPRAQFLPSDLAQRQTLLTEAEVLAALRNAEPPLAKQLKRARAAFRRWRQKAEERAAAVDDAQLTIAPVPGASRGDGRPPGEVSS